MQTLSLGIALSLVFWSGLVFQLVMSKNRALTALGGYFPMSLGTALIRFLGGYAERINTQAQRAGVSWHGGHTLMLWFMGGGISTALYFTTGNVFLLMAAVLVVCLLPGLIIQRSYQRQRLKLYRGLADFLRRFLAHLPDQGNLNKALERSLEGDVDKQIETVFAGVLQQIKLGESTRAALESCQQQLGLRKFGHILEIMIKAHQEGWSESAQKAMDKGIQAMEADLRAIEWVGQKQKKRFQKLMLMLATAWSFPFVLSMLNLPDKNIYLSTILGQILIASYLFSSFYVIKKGYDCFSLEVDEL